MAELQAAEAADKKTAEKAAKDAAELGVTVSGLHDFVQRTEAAAGNQFKALKTFVATDDARNAATIGELNNNRDALSKARVDAQAAAATAKQDVADMNTALNQERDLRQRYATLVEPRTIDDAHFAAMVTALTAFPGTPVEFAVSRDPEVTDLLVRIEDALIAAHWKIQAWGGSGWPLNLDNRPDIPPLGEVTGRGVLISIAVSDRPKLLPPGDALITALRAAGILVIAGAVPDKMPDGKPNPVARPGAIHVVVGTRS